VESDPGKGSAFQFTVRVEQAAPDTSHKPAAEPAAASTAGPGIRVLVVEDNSVNQRLFVRLIENLGHEASVAPDGKQALALLASGSYDLILMDVQMPEMDGFEATREIRRSERRRGAHTPILALTAHAMKGDKERCLEAGMDGYLAKPVQVSEIAEAIDNLVIASRWVNERVN